MKIQFLFYLTIFITIGCSNNAPDFPSEAKPAPDIETPEIILPKITLEELEAQIDQLPQLSSFLIYKGDEILTESYNGVMNRNRPINIKSASKNIISALIGIAVDKGLISDIDDPISDYLPSYFTSITDSLKKEITIRHLLTMSSGLRSTSFGNYGAWVVSRDWVGYALNGEQQHPPGIRMRYSTGDTHILSAVLTEATGMSTRRFAEQYLFGPMNIRIGGWDRDPQGYYFGGNNMALSPGGLLAFGKLYLNGGMHEGNRLISSKWVEQSVHSHFPNTSFNPRDHDYGFLWWKNTFGQHEAWFAWGYGGQYMFILPELDAIVVLTSNPDSRSRGLNNSIYRMMDDVIVPFIFHHSKLHSASVTVSGID